MRRPGGEAAETIVRVLTEARSTALTFAELQQRTGLPNATVHDNVKRLCKEEKIQTSEDGHGTIWISSDNR